MFIGCSGIDFRDGNVSIGEFEDVGIKKVIMSIFKELYLMVLIERFNLDGIFNFLNIVDFNSIIIEVVFNNIIMILF